MLLFRVPVLKLKNYSIDEIFEKNLLVLLLYYIINYEKELCNIANDDTSVFQDILNMTRRIMHYLLRKEPALKERMSDIMALINTCQTLKATKEITLERLKIEFSLSDQQANEAIEKYWK